MSATTPATRNAVWAESGQTTVPSQGEQQGGFVAGKPSRRKTNWLLNWLDNAVQYILANFAASADVTTALGALHTTVTGETTTAISTALGTASGEITHGDITASNNNFSVAYEHACRFPGSTEKIVFCRLSWPSNSGIAGGATITLANTAAFATGADNAIAGVSFAPDQGTTAYPQVRATVSGNQTVVVSFIGNTEDLGFDIELMIQGH